VSDVTVPDDTEFPPGASFTKTWRMRNTGTCAWDADTRLVFSSGDQMNGPDSVLVGAVAPGSTTDVSASMDAPSTPGTYEGHWQLQAGDGTRFGAIPYVRIVVPEPVATTDPTCSTPVDPALQAIVDHAEIMDYDMGCPTGPATSVYGAFQEYWANVEDLNPHTHFRSLMIWRSDIQEIYIIRGQDTNASEGMIYAYTDTWEEGQPEVHPDCASMTVPSGYLMPIRGFGKVWCYNGLEDEVGWPAEQEIGLSLLIQPMQSGLLIKVGSPSPIGYLIAMHYQAVHAVTMMVAP
jgi:hypothetical protein